MDTNQTRLKNITQTLIHTYCKAIKKPVLANNVWQMISNQSSAFLERVKSIDNLCTENDYLLPLNELFFDILMVYHIGVEREGDEAYFDSNEWNTIENKTLERGSEYLNIVLYLYEAADENVEISLDDFLNEFLLVDEDEFQQEHAIYEPFIINEQLLEASSASLIKIKNGLSDDNPVKPFFMPFAMFFQSIETTEEEEAELTDVLDAFEIAVYQSLLKLR